MNKCSDLKRFKGSIPTSAGILGVMVLLLAVLPAQANSPPDVTSVTAVQREGTKLVDVTFNLNDPDADLMSVTLWFSEDGGVSFPFECTTAWGDVGEGVSSGTGKHIVWDAGADYPGHTGDTYVVKVVANDGQTSWGFVQVPAGVFIMGDGVTYCGWDEREVTLTRDFYLARTEVTNQQYLDAVQWAYDHGYVTATTSDVYDTLDGSTVLLLSLNNAYSEIQFDGAGTFYLRESPSSYAQNAYPGGYDPSDHPVKMVSWYGAVRYCDWLSLLAGLPRAYDHSGDWSCNGGDPYGASGYRLPTDAEWEYAAQFDDERVYPWGNEDPDCSRVNFYDGAFCVGWTTPVGSYPGAPSIGGEGLYDMAGNVWEWCNDWHVCNLGTSPATDPVGPGSGLFRVLRGGSWGSGGDLRCANRFSNDPSLTYLILGFRVARTVTP